MEVTILQAQRVGIRGLNELEMAETKISGEDEDVSDKRV